MSPVGSTKEPFNLTLKIVAYKNVHSAELRQEEAPATDHAVDHAQGHAETAHDMVINEEAMLPDGLTAGPDLDLPQLAENDTFVVEEEIEIERSVLSDWSSCHVPGHYVFDSAVVTLFS